MNHTVLYAFLVCLPQNPLRLKIAEMLENKFQAYAKKSVFSLFTKFMYPLVLFISLLLCS